MEKFWQLLKKGKEKNFLVLDIGTEAIKRMTFQKNNLGQFEILEKSLEYLDQYGVFNTQDFEKEIFKKAILKSLGDWKEKNNFSYIVSLPPNVLIARIVSQDFKREDKEKIIDKREEKVILQSLAEKSKEKVVKEWTEKSGILEKEIEVLNLNILGIRIDGYSVPQLQGYKGKQIEVKVLVSFLIKEYFKKFEKIFQEIGLKEKKIVHLAEGLNSYFKKIPDALFVDFGGEMTQFFSTKNNCLEMVGEMNLGGRFFSQVLSEKLGIKIEEARLLKERYSRGDFSPETIQRLKEIFDLPLRFWFEDLKKRLKKNISGNFLFQKIFVFGGSAQLPEIRKILKEGNWESFFLSKKPEVEVFFPEELQKINDGNALQYVNCFLLLSASQK